jgi:D-citramalate synthase
VFQFLEFLSTQPVKGYYPILWESLSHHYFDFENYCKISNIHFDFHAHNDYDLSIANVMEAIKAGKRIACYGKRNGERAGNAPLKVPLP